MRCHECQDRARPPLRLEGNTPKCLRGMRKRALYSVFTAWTPVVLWGVASTAAEVLPPPDAPMFLDVVKDGQPSAVLVLPDAASEIERIAADKLIAWCETYAQVKLPLQRTSDLGPAAEGNYILLGTGENQPLIADMIKNGDGGPADLPFLSDEGFGLETVEKAKAKYLVIAGRKPKGVFHGAVYVRDFLLDILPPAEGVVIREVKMVRSPALAIRGPYLLTQYGKTLLYTLDHWKHIIDMMAEGGINQIHWWIAGMYPSERFPETFVATTTPMSGAIALKWSRKSGSFGRAGCKTWSSSSRATRLMAGGTIVERVRPRGLSGCVTITPTSNPSPTRARSDGTAKSGVPKNAIFTSPTPLPESHPGCIPAFLCATFSIFFAA